MNKNIYISPFKGIDRRQFLKGLGAAIALPNLETFADKKNEKVAGARNFVAMGTYLGWHRESFYPKTEGAIKELPTTTKPLEKFASKMSIFSGLDHRAPNGHNAWANYMCGRKPGAYSLDQMIAAEIGQESRFSSLQLIAGSGEPSAIKAISFSKNGTSLPMIARPTVLYRKLFPTASDRKRAEYLLSTGTSVLDDVLVMTQTIQKDLSSKDKEKLSEYYDAIRTVEKDMAKHLKNVNVEIKAPSGATAPDSDPISPSLQIEASNMLYDLLVLALQSDSTRVATLLLDGLGQVFSLDGRKLGSGYHGLSHHGNDPNMIRDLVSIEKAHMACLARFLEKLESTQGSVTGKNLLDETIVVAGTGMGNASVHDNKDLPTLVVGGGLKHGKYHKFDRKGNVLLGNLYVSLQNQLGMNSTQFSNSTGNLNEVVL